MSMRLDPVTVRATESTGAEDLPALASSYWEDVLRINPIFATEVGDPRFDDRLPDLRLAFRAEAMSAYRRGLQGAASIDKAELTMVERTTVDVIEAHARQQLERLELRYDLLETVDHLWGPGTLLSQLSQIQTVETAEQAKSYCRRLRAIPAYLEGAIEQLREGQAVGLTAPHVVVARSLAQIDRLLGLPLAASAAVTIAPEPQRAIIEEVIREHVLPAYARYRQALELYRPHARETIGLSALPDGEALYASRLRAWTSLDLSPDRIHELGLDELEAITAEQTRIAVGMGYGSVPEAKEAARERTRTTSRETILHTATSQVERAWAMSAKWFGKLPAANCSVRPIDLSREADVLDHYVGPSQDGSRPGTFYVSTRPGRSLYRLATTVYHEANPGHHLQTSLAQETADRPMIRRFSGDLVGGAVGEGWGLYAEHLADEMGLFENDMERLGMLELQALRAARLVIDTGIHARNWSREQAIGELEKAWADNREDAEIEIDRYIALPGQATCYALGQRAIFGWRRVAAERLGASFSLATFHDALLGLGSLPLPAIERELMAAMAPE